MQDLWETTIIKKKKKKSMQYFQVRYVCDSLSGFFYMKITTWPKRRASQWMLRWLEDTGAEIYQNRLYSVLILYD